MPKAFDDKIYYSPNEVAQAVGISKGTLLRWIKQRIVKDSDKRDRNGWRLFTETEVETIRKFTQSAK